MTLDRSSRKVLFCHLGMGEQRQICGQKKTTDHMGHQTGAAAAFCSVIWAWVNDDRYVGQKQQTVRDIRQTGGGVLAQLNDGRNLYGCE